MPTKTPLITTPEALDAEWSDAQLLLDTTDHYACGYLLAQVLLGWKLANIKASLGFRGVGRPPKDNGPAAKLRGNLSWREHVESNLRLPSTGESFHGATADRFIQVYESAKSRLLKLGQDRAVALLGQAPSDVAERDLADLKEAVTKVTTGATQAELLAELRIVKTGPTGNGGYHPRQGDPPAELTLQQAAFDFITPAFQGFVGLRRQPDQWETYLRALPRVGQGPDSDQPFGLQDLLLHVESMADDIKAALKS